MPKLNKTILIYSSFSQYSATDFIVGVDNLIEKDPSAELEVAINSNGGDPDYGFGMIHKFQQFPNKKSVINHGKAYSMALYFNCYTDETSCLDVTEFLLHRAAYAEWVERDPELFDEDRRKSLKATNDKLRAAFEAKVDVEKFNNLKVMKDKGITLDDVFSIESRIDVRFNAKEAKAIGLIKNIVTITPSIKAEIESNYRIAANYTEENKKPNNTQNQKPNKMTLAELKSAHPELFAQVVATGVEQEKERVEAIMVFADVDGEIVKKAIASGKDLTKAQTNELLLKAVKGQKADEVVAENHPTSKTGTDKTPEQVKKEAEDKAAADFLADVSKGI